MSTVVKNGTAAEVVTVVKPTAVVETVAPVVATRVAVVETAAPARVVAEVPARPAKPEIVIKPKHHGGGHHGGRKSVIATVGTERALLDDIQRYRGALVGTIDELHTRLSPKYQIDQLKSTWTQAGTDALSILKNEGSPVDETRKKKAEAILKGGGALGGLFALNTLRKLAKRAKSNHRMRKAVEKGMPDEHLKLIGVIEGVGVDAGETIEFTNTEFDD